MSLLPHPQDLGTRSSSSLTSSNKEHSKKEHCVYSIRCKTIGMQVANGIHSWQLMVADINILAAVCLLADGKLV